MTIEVIEATGEIVPAFGGTLTPMQASARAAWIREVTKAALTEGVDYGKIPGTGDKPTLLKPGAEMLLLAAGYGFTMTKVDDADAQAHRGVTYRCTVRRGDDVVSECDGYAGFDESRFFVSAEEAERRERYNAQKYRRPVNATRFVEYRAPWNTLVKMAQKRALVGATLNATAASGLFVADMDDADEPPAPEPPPVKKAAATRKKAAAPKKNTASAQVIEHITPSRPAGTDELEAVLNGLAQPMRDAFREWRRSKGWAWPPVDEEQLSEMSAEVDRLLARENEEAETYG